ncbi:hypothetical protein C1645_817759 [Glomus cerebriforme]|uniref:Uncharacterized protein n=1 Tax=Glomus cerebriforme TaxID=658196 RepID=A0A397TE40_9GLOM|nr:hypothetical protein C1645_817759 [Glomus cerebriforme]
MKIKYKTCHLTIDSIETEMLTISLKNKDILEPFEEHEIFEEFENPESETYTEFPNNAYKNLMILVTNHKLNNRAGNDIICFFNKHSNLTVSPLPKNIKKGRAFMDNMKVSYSAYNKVFITYHNDKDYHLYYQNLI